MSATLPLFASPATTPPTAWPPRAALGCFSEIIAYTSRVFAPVDRPAVGAAVLRRHPVAQVLEPGR